MATTFTPVEHGFKFRNDFVDELIELPGGGHAFNTRGRCGGMAFLALDHWRHGMPIPGTATVPADETPLARLIQRRLFDSFLLNGLRYVEFSLMPDHPKWWVFGGAAKATRNQEFPKIKASIDQGQACAIGLCRAASPLELGKDHQVVCYSYVEGPSESALLIYDNNYPRSEQRLTFASRYARNEDMAITHSDESKWRAFFLESYHPERPPAGL